MIPYQTDLHIASQTARELVVTVPPFNPSGWVWISSILLMVVGYGVLFSVWRSLTRPIPPLMGLIWLIPVAVAGPFLVLGLIGQIKTQIILSADRGTLSVQKTLMSFPIGSKEYPFSEVRSVRVGVADITLFLYVDLTDKPAENLTGATDQTGYAEVANVMNAFLDANRLNTNKGSIP
jgi:energy-coupling factor transporter transmembrane protein EcfT